MTLLCGIPAVTAKQCTAFSNVGTTVQLGASFQVFCIFGRNTKDRCTRPSIHVNSNEIFVRTEHNSTTLFVNVSNITENRTYSCKCGTELCGLDLDTGYPPDIPQSLTCIQKGETGNVTCTWKRGRETYLQTTSSLWVKTQVHNSTARVTSIPGSGNVTFPVFESQAQYSVWVNASNKLGSVVSSCLNFTLNDIVRPMPPHITRMDCSSWYCMLLWDDRWKSLLLQVRHRVVQGIWTTHTLTANASRTWNISDLVPATVYEVQARCKLGPERGVWSDWSPVITSKTDEEVPLKKLDMWYTEEYSQSQKKSFRELSEPEARGRILGYRLKVRDLQKGSTWESDIDSGKDLPISCSRCAVTLSAYNSKGHSPPTDMTIPLSAHSALAPRNVSYTPYYTNYSIAISWQKPASAGPVNGYLVEWHQANRRKKGLMWLRVGQDQLSAVITENIQPGECYQGAVYALYESMMGKADFVDAYSWQSVPTKGPVPKETVEGGRVTVSWEAIPWEHQRGCIKSYTIYLKRGENIINYGPIGPSVRNYTIMSGLQPGVQHTLWMTGWTAAGEGPSGEMKVFYPPQEEQQGMLILTAGISTFLVCLVVMSLCQIPSVRQRASACCFCLMPDIIPDPANSKWAKEYVAVKGQMTLDYTMCLSDSTLSEEEPYTVQVQECQDWPSRNPELSRASLSGEATTVMHLRLQPDQDLQDLPSYQGQPSCPYIKSFSHESDSSEQTHESRSTEVTVDYISSHGLLAEGGEEVEDEEDVLNFFPCTQSLFLEPLTSFGGNLTLDAVKIDCSGFMD
ncbi:interleukin-12 receptor subunit beta-2 [Megalops cyprinoides]|uniref:interleukin-12 receptor subunit beta-2 n=1 Tax=Megalops cyprinoides TaxID=118141 RepID=UPI001864CE02|nr:interleukin-12 receptor subunit beta-2 [Megalops cyprinoides]